MFDQRFSHFVSYGATDQETIRELRESIHGLLVPGTVAAFQHQGTGGFVLTLSATVEGARYVIDPRFPLFQQALPAPKKSHESLAEILGEPSLIRNRPPEPSDFDSALTSRLASNWVEFNHSYRGAAGLKFDKYARRLNEPVSPQNSTAPEYVIAPYFIAENSSHDWWARSRDLFDAVRAAADGLPVLRCVASEDPGGLGDLLADIDDDKVAIWVSGFNELETDISRLAEYLDVIRSTTDRGARAFALYGGFFAVLASSAGLAGASHGIGFGEHRNWLELPRSGPPPSRYYWPRAHRYVSQEDAERLWRQAPDLVECACRVCSGRSPLELEYHDLMKHSVECRAQEIDDWVGLGPSQAVARLESELEVTLDTLAQRLPDHMWRRFSSHTEHLPRWISALRRHSGT